MVVIDHKGMIIALEAFICKSHSAHEAKIAAIFKVSETAKRNKWNNFAWNYDDKKAVIEILHSKFLRGWNAS